METSLLNIKPIRHCSNQNCGEAVYHFIKANAQKKAAKIAIDKGFELIGKGYVKEFMDLLNEFREDEVEKQYWGKILVLKGDPGTSSANGMMR